MMKDKREIKKLKKTARQPGNEGKTRGLRQKGNIDPMTPREKFPKGRGWVPEKGGLVFLGNTWHTNFEKSRP